MVTLSGVVPVAPADNKLAEQLSVSLGFVVVLGVHPNPVTPDTVFGLGHV
jgi:hypothetical protein